VTLSPFVIVSVLLQIVLLTFFEFAMPKAQPEKIQRVLVYLSTVGAVAVTGLNVPLVDCARQALDGSQPPVGERGREVRGLLCKVGDEGVQPERTGRQREDRLHQRAGLIGEIVPLVDREPR
jgi:hypothetical protein